MLCKVKFSSPTSAFKALSSVLSVLPAWHQGPQVTIIDSKTQIPDPQGKYIPCTYLSIMLDLLGSVWFSGEKGTIHLFSLLLQSVSYLSHKYHFLAHSSWWRFFSTIITRGGPLLPFAALKNKKSFHLLREIWNEEKRIHLEGTKRSRRASSPRRYMLKPPASTLNEQIHNSVPKSDFFLVRSSGIMQSAEVSFKESLNQRTNSSWWNNRLWWVRRPWGQVALLSTEGVFMEPPPGSRQRVYL